MTSLLRRTVLVLIAAGLLSAMTGCDAWQVWRGNHSRLRFQVAAGPVPRNAANRAVLSDAIEPTHAAVMGLSEADRFIEYFKLDGEPVEAVVPRGDSYAIAIYGPDSDGRLISAGPVKIGTFDLDLLPISEDGASEIDLGVLSGSVEGFVTDVGDEEISDSLGYSTTVLRGFGARDGQILRMLNPDANADGVIDHEQGIEWGLFVSHWFDLTEAAAQLTPEPGFTRDQLLTIGEITMNFWTTEDFNRYFTADQLGELAVELPVEVYDHDYNRWTSTLIPGLGGPAEPGSGYGPILDSGGTWGGGAYSQFSLGQSVEPHGPYVGDHVFHIGTDRYLLDGVNFYEHTDGFGSVPFPTYSLVMNADGLAESVAWRWHWVEAGIVVPAPADLVRLLISEFVVQFGPPGGGAEGWSFTQPERWYEGGVLDGLEAQGIDMTVNMLSFYTRDLHGNTVQNICPETHLGQ